MNQTSAIRTANNPNASGAPAMAATINVVA
jgi:hypothetical protein